MRKFLIALTFLTRLPAPIPKDITQEEMGKSSAFFPLVGLILGGILVGFNWLISGFWEPFTVNALLLVLLIILTGGLHLDGLMDTCDGVFSGRKRERMLEIMKDSNVGAFGVLACVCALLLKLAFLVEVGGGQKWQALLIMPALGRWSMSFVLSVFPYARKEGGLGTAFSDFANAMSLVWASITLVAASALILGWQTFWITIIPPAIGAYLIAWGMSRKLGGLTGDTYGAICELTEICTLAMCAVYFAI